MLNAKKIAIHLSVFVAMALSLYLGKGLLSPLKLEIVRLLSAIDLGAFISRPLSEWMCQKILHDQNQ